MTGDFGPAISGKKDTRGMRIASEVICRVELAAALAAMLVITPAVAQSGPVTVTITLNIPTAATVDIAKVREATRSAIGSLLSQRANVITSSGPDTTRMHDRLRGGTLLGGAEDGDGARVAGPEAGPPPTAAALGAGRAGSGTGFGDPRRSGVGVGSSLLSGHGGLGTMGGAMHRFGGASKNRTIANPVRFTGSLENGMGNFAFATSLSQWRTAAEALDQARLASAGMAPSGSRRSTYAMTGLGSIDIWAEGRSSYFSYTRIDGRRSGHAAVLHSGIDMVVMPGMLIGLMGSYDWIAQNSSTIGQNGDGRGWMAGPYLSARLTKSLYFDMRYAWGKSANHINPLGAFVDQFSATRQLVSAKLTGDMHWGAMRFRPSAEVIWFTERSKAYVNAVGIGIPGQSVSLGRAMFGPELGYTLELSDKSVLEPFIGLKGVWDFAQTRQATAGGVPIGRNQPRGRIELGLSYQAPNGMTIRSAGSYDGIGSGSYRSMQGRVGLAVPLP